MLTRFTITQPRRLCEFVQPFLDACAILSSMAIVRWIVNGQIDDASLALGLIAVVVFQLVSQLTGLQRRGQSGSPNEEIATIATTWMLTLMVLAVIEFATRSGEYYSRANVLGWALMVPAMIGLGRMCLRIVQFGMLRHGIGTRRVAIAGMNQLGHQTAKNIAEEPTLGLNLVGFFDDRSTERDTTPESMMSNAIRCGNLRDLVEESRNGKVDTILITIPMRAEARIRKLLDELSDTTVSVYIVPDFFVFELLHARWISMGGLPAVSVFENPLFGVDGVAKRIADIALATTALVVLGIPMLVIALLVKLTSPGPVFFRQRRYGLDGREIRVWKFRSMRTCDDGAVVKQATKGDSRITPLGAILRKTSLDELPQLFNVLDGSMSLVGPRPHASAHNEQYRSLIRGYMLRHKVKPGITGLAQVNGCRGETETIDKMEARVRWDHQYIRSWSMWLDIKILFRTLAVAWRQPEAH
jgi:putative colanic acid biosysnthesis UDP-glucose lipid carrier transferase